MVGERKSGALRRSVYIPCELAEALAEALPAEELANFNALVAAALREYVAARERRALEEAMARMAADEDVRRECGAIGREFARAEKDGLK
jgi:metal-responsive CopG/Arc/MetJ family transcriptional regulator